METLDNLLSNIFMANNNVHSRHFNVIGSEFRTLHLLFKEIYESLQDWYDTIGELIRRNGEYAIHDVEEMLKRSNIKSDIVVLSAEGMLLDTSSELKIIMDMCERLINSSRYNNATQNDLAQLSSDMDKLLYQVVSLMAK